MNVPRLNVVSAIMQDQNFDSENLYCLEENDRLEAYEMSMQVVLYMMSRPRLARYTLNLVCNLMNVQADLKNPMQAYLN